MKSTMFSPIRCFVLLCLICPAHGAPSRSSQNVTVTALALRVPRQAASSIATSVATDFNIDTPWEESLMPSPMVVALLGQLMVISGKIDFPLIENAPKDGFKYMRHPESFRASLVQVSNDGWSAFMAAHKNMDRIQLYMQQIPTQVRTTVKLLSSASTRLIRAMLPNTLNRIQSIGQTCVQLSAETESKFIDVMMLVDELLEVTESSRGTNQQKLAQIRIEMNVTAERKKMIERLGEDLKARQNMIDNEVAKRRALYDEAVNDIPTGWRAIFQDLGRSVVGLVKDVPQMLTMNFGLGGGFGGGGGGGSTSAGAGANTSPPEDFQRASTLGLFRSFFDSVSKVKNTVLQALQGKLPSSDQSPGQVVQYVKTLLDQFEKGFQSARCDLTNVAIGFIDEARALMKGDVKVQLDGFLSSNNNSNTNDGGSSPRIAADFDGLMDRMKPVVAQASAASSSPGELMSQSMGGSNSGGDSSSFSCTGCSERFKANLQMEALKQAEQRQDQIFQEMMKYHDEMKELVTAMARLNLNKISYEEILDLLRRGIELLARIRQEWSKLIAFFSSVSVRAENALKHILAPFLETARIAEGMIGELTQEERQFSLDQLMEEANEINRVSYFLYTLSSTYYDVSSRFLLNRMAGLARMLATDSEEERARLLAQLFSEAEEAEDAIKQMAQDRRQQAARVMQARKEELQAIVDRLGPPTEIESKAIRGAYGQQVHELN